MTPELGSGERGAVAIDVERLVAGRMLVEASSGAGKSWTVRRLLEQTHGAVQQLVLDPEGEFHTLRARFDFVLAGPGGDCPAEPRSAALLARKLLELGVSAIVDLSDANRTDQRRFVDAFLRALVHAPRSLWHPCLVVIDEADIFGSMYLLKLNDRAASDRQPWSSYFPSGCFLGFGFGGSGTGVRSFWRASLGSVSIFSRSGLGPGLDFVSASVMLQIVARPDSPHASEMLRRYTASGVDR